MTSEMSEHALQQNEDSHWNIRIRMWTNGQKTSIDEAAICDSSTHGSNIDITVLMLH